MASHIFRYSTPNAILTADPAVPCDPNFDNNLALLHFDEGNGSSTIVDVTGRSWTNNGLSLSSSQTRFGTSSLRLTGVNGQSLTTPSFINFNANFTIEFWVYVQAVPVTGGYLFSIDGLSSVHASNSIHVMQNGNIAFHVRYAVHPANTSYSITGNITFNEWHHIACTRFGNELNMFIDGVKLTPATITTEPLAQNGQPTYIGRYYHTNNPETWTGHMDEIRVSNFARYTENFAVPTEPFADVKCGPVFANMWFLFAGYNSQVPTVYYAPTPTEGFSKTVNFNSLLSIPGNFGGTWISFIDNGIIQINSSTSARRFDGLNDESLITGTSAPILTNRYNLFTDGNVLLLGANTSNDLSVSDDGGRSYATVVGPSFGNGTRRCQEITKAGDTWFTKSAGLSPTIGRTISNPPLSGWQTISSSFNTQTIFGIGDYIHAIDLVGNIRRKLHNASAWTIIHAQGTLLSSSEQRGGGAHDGNGKAIWAVNGNFAPRLIRTDNYGASWTVMSNPPNLSSPISISYQVGYWILVYTSTASSGSFVAVTNSINGPWKVLPRPITGSSAGYNLVYSGPFI